MQILDRLHIDNLKQYLNSVLNKAAVLVQSNNSLLNSKLAFQTLEFVKDTVDSVVGYIDIMSVSCFVYSIAFLLIGFVSIFQHSYQ